MQINTNSNINFNARNPQIRFADDITRKINQEFPRFSATRMECLNASKLFVNEIEAQCGKINKMRDYKKAYETKPTLVEKAKSLFSTIKLFQLGNCGESAELAFMFAKINNIKDCVIAGLYHPKGNDYDHAVLFVKGKKPYIIDPWLGFADYIPNAIKRYQGEFKNCFELLDDEQIIFKEEPHVLNYDFTKKEVNKLKKAYSQYKLNPNA